MELLVLLFAKKLWRASNPVTYPEQDCLSGLAYLVNLTAPNK